MRHHESGRGVSPEVKLPTADVVSLVRIGDNLEKVVIHTGKATIPEKLPACRTQIRVHIKDTKRVRETLMGAHMIMTYGDYSEKISYAAVFLGLELL